MHLQRIISGLNTDFILTPSYSFHKSLHHKSLHHKSLHHKSYVVCCLFVSEVMTSCGKDIAGDILKAQHALCAGTLCTKFYSKALIRLKHAKLHQK